MRFALIVIRTGIRSSYLICYLPSLRLVPQSTGGEVTDPSIESLGAASLNGDLKPQHKHPMG
jgi:hypothetical protein